MSIKDNLLKLGIGGIVLASDALNAMATSLIKADSEGPESTPGGSDEDTAKTNPVPQEPADNDPKSLFFDPFSIIEQLGYKDKPSSVSYGTLKRIIWKTPILQAIVQTRINQMASFCQPTHDRHKLGFKVQLREHEKEPSKAERKWIQRMEILITRTGVTDNPRGRPNFETFLRKTMRDSLVYDQMCFEVVPDKKGNPAEWYAVDASTIRLADSASTYLNEDLEESVRYVQVYDGMVINEYTQAEICFGIRNPSTDIKLYGYGMSELEMLINVITSILYSWEYNQRVFSQGMVAKGILNFKGVIPNKQLQSFRRHFYSMLTGFENSHRTPVTNAEDIQYINLQQSAKDMEFSAWMDFLIKVSCSMYQIDPIEVNFKYGNTGQRTGMNEAGNKEKITESKERGLRPLLRFMETQINQYILWPINESFEFAFVGLDSLTRNEVADLSTKQVKSWRMVDEIRAENDLPPLPEGKGEVILDPVWMQFSQSKDMPMDGGMPGEGDFGEGDEENGNVDFGKLLSQYDEDEDNEEQEKPAKPAKEKQPVKKSGNTITIDLEL